MCQAILGDLFDARFKPLCPARCELSLDCTAQAGVVRWVAYKDEVLERPLCQRRKVLVGFNAQQNTNWIANKQIVAGKDLQRFFVPGHNPVAVKGAVGDRPFPMHCRNRIRGVAGKGFAQRISPRIEKEDELGQSRPCGYLLKQGIKNFLRNEHHNLCRIWA